jgi:hypothetical protein
MQRLQYHPLIPSDFLVPLSLGQAPYPLPVQIRTQELILTFLFLTPTFSPFTRVVTLVRLPDPNDHGLPSLPWAPHRPGPEEQKSVSLPREKAGQFGPDTWLLGDGLHFNISAWGVRLHSTHPGTQTGVQG